VGQISNFIIKLIRIKEKIIIKIKIKIRNKTRNKNYKWMFRINDEDKEC